jgi:rod shape-determining protein MreD
LIKRAFINFIIVASIVALYVTNYKSFIEIRGVLPDLILIFTVLNGIFIDSTFGMFFGFFAGLSIDIASYHVLGFYSLIYTLIGYSTSITKIFNINNSVASGVFIFSLLLLKGIIFLIAGLLFLNKDFIIIYFRDRFLIEIIYTVIISFPVFLVYRKIFSKKRKV